MTGARTRLRRGVAGAGLVLALAAAPPARGQPASAHPAACPDTVRLRLLDFATEERDAGRLLQLAGVLPAAPALTRRASTEADRPVCRPAAPFLAWALEAAPADGGPALRVLPVTLEVEHNSAYRRDRNNGSFRGGVGASTAVGAGVAFRWKGVSAALAPRVVRDANGDFETLPMARPGMSPWASPERLGGYRIDFPQRFGTDTQLRLDPGRSFVRVANRRFEAGLSTENFWLGSGRVHPILVGASAPGFPHLFAGTVEPLDLWIARVGVHAVLGRLSESDFFDEDPDNDRRAFASLLVAVEPRWIPGLHLGLARVHHQTVPPEGLAWGDYLRAAFDLAPTYTSGGNPIESNALGAVLARWVLPQAGFEVFAEWAREDTPYSLRDLLEEPDWTQAYALGFSQLVTLERARLRWYGELVHLGEAAPVRGGKGFFSYYTHTRVPQGHTHQGQILGAAPGPGSDAQIVGVDVFHDRGQSGLWLERNRYDDDTYYRRWSRIYGESRHDVELGVGVRHHGDVGPVRVAAELLYARRANRAFLGMEDRTMPRRVETNVGVRVRAAWTP